VSGGLAIAIPFGFPISSFQRFSPGIIIHLIFSSREQAADQRGLRRRNSTILKILFSRNAIRSLGASLPETASISSPKPAKTPKEHWLTQVEETSIKAPSMRGMAAAKARPSITVFMRWGLTEAPSFIRMARTLTRGARHKEASAQIGRRAIVIRSRSKATSMMKEQDRA
jgi:hypothetical protein